MKITDITSQIKNPDRVNIHVDGKYLFSLDIFQVTQLGIKVGRVFDQQELDEWKNESEFGKLYSRALEYTMLRQHSAKEIRDYLWRKTRTTKVKSRTTGEIRDREGVSKEIADRVYERLLEKGYVDDERFTRYWLENRRVRTGASKRKLVNELRAKGVEQRIVDALLPSSERNDTEEIDKIIARKRAKYDDQKLMQYLARQGFDFDLIKEKINEAQYQESETD
jgi:regulatory protein